MGRNLSTLLLAACLAAGVSFVAGAQAGDQPENPPPRDSGSTSGARDSGGARRPGGFHLLPPRADEQLNLTADQKKQLADLEVEVKAKLDKILTAEQQEKLEQMRPPRRPDGAGGASTGRRGGDGAGNPGAEQPVPPALRETRASGDAARQPASRPDGLPEDGSRIAVTFTGGYDTEPQDHGRPVVLIAAALNVPSEVFRKAFSNVKPAGPGQEPEPEQVRKNKETLLRSLGPYGITNDLLDTVSNYYRYSRSRGEMWRHTPATAYATVHNGAVTGFTITNPGAGYSSPPKVSVAGMIGLTASATLSFGTDFKTNGSIKEITAGLTADPAK